jgi:hypothetical protein
MTGKFSNEKKRQADLYIFCLLKTQDQGELNPMDLDQWIFYVHQPLRDLDEIVQEIRDLETETEGLLEQILDFGNGAKI